MFEHMKLGQYVNQSDPEKNAWYPRHVSDRADILLDEMSQESELKLFRALQAVSLGEWLEYLEEEKDEICRFDALSTKERAKELRQENNLVALRLLHACVFVELWRCHLTQSSFPLPPSGLPLDESERHREFLLESLAAYNTIPERAYWPFGALEETSVFPFRSASED